MAITIAIRGEKIVSTLTALESIDAMINQITTMPLKSRNHLNLYGWRNLTKKINHPIPWRGPNHLAPMLKLHRELVLQYPQYRYLRKL